MTRIPENPPVIFRGPFLRCGPHGEPAVPDGAGIHVLRCPREARPWLGHRSFGAPAPGAWSRPPTPLAAPPGEAPGLRLVAGTPDGDGPIRSGAIVHVFPRR